jgi:Domain of unknown function (DUF1707)
MADQHKPGREVAAAAGRGALRVSHDDRDQVAETLRVAAGDGRLTAEELDERLERALTARTYDDLAVLTADLPATGMSLAPPAGAAAAAGPAPGAAIAAKDLVTINCSSSTSERVGRWAVPARMSLRVVNGVVNLDFTEAIVTRPVLQVDVQLHSSKLTLVTRPGVSFDVDEVSVHSGQVKVGQRQDGSAPVFLHVIVTGTCNNSVIVARPPDPPRPPRRSLREWLRRAPRPRAIEA